MKTKLNVLRVRAARAAAKGGAVVGALAVSAGAHAAATVDPAVQTGLQDAAVNVGAIAALVTLVVLAIKVGKWINRAL